MNLMSISRFWDIKKEMNYFFSDTNEENYMVDKGSMFYTIYKHFGYTETPERQRYFDTLDQYNWIPKIRRRVFYFGEQENPVNIGVDLIPGIMRYGTTWSKDDTYRVIGNNFFSCNPEKFVYKVITDKYNKPHHILFLHLHFGCEFFVKGNKLVKFPTNDVDYIFKESKGYYQPTILRNIRSHINCPELEQSIQDYHLMK